MSILEQFQELIIGFAGLVIVMGVFFILMLLGWPGEPDPDSVGQPDVYGERVHPGSMIKQPWCTWSNLAPICFGIAILVIIGLDKSSHSKPHNPMATATFYSALYGYLVIFLGPGSMFFHASLTKWGGWVDNLSMDLFISFVLLYDIGRISRIPVGVFFTLFLLVNAIAGVLLWLKDCGKLIFGIMIGATAMAEVLILLFHVSGVHRDASLLVLALLVFLIALIIWKLSQREVELPLLGKFSGPLYMPDSWFQGHAIWHVLTAVAALLIFFYLRTES